MIQTSYFQSIAEDFDIMVKSYIEVGAANMANNDKPILKNVVWSYILGRP
jgi:hypothetical protein